MSIFKFTFIAFFFAMPLAFAKVFNNAYISFEIPDNWKCSLEQTEWVCRSELNKEAKEAIIILTAKEVGPTDSYALYEQHLNSPIRIQLKTGSTADSKISYPAKTIQINNQQWIDGLHLGSEVLNYYTRYLAAIKNNKIAILVTFSAHKDFYTKYSQDFFRTVQSLRVIATDSIIASRQGPINPSSGILGVNTAGMLPAEPEALPEESSGNSKQKIFLALGIIIAAVGIYLFIKKRQSS